jgi:hypothetical protein
MYLHFPDTPRMFPNRTLCRIRDTAEISSERWSLGSVVYLEIGVFRCKSIDWTPYPWYYPVLSLTHHQILFDVQRSKKGKFLVHCPLSWNTDYKMQLWLPLILNPHKKEPREDPKRQHSSLVSCSSACPIKIHFRTATRNQISVTGSHNQQVQPNALRDSLCIISHMIGPVSVLVSEKTDTRDT